MSKIINCYADAKFVDTFRNRYTRLKFGKPKHQYYLMNRRSDVMLLDEYDRYILQNKKPGNTIVYDTAGYYLDGAIDNLTVVELQPVVLHWYPTAIIDTGPDSVDHLYGTADNFIVINTIQVRWRSFDYIRDYWRYQSRFLRPGCQIFWGFRSIYILHNKLRYHFSDILADWLQEMEQYGFYLVGYTHDLIPIDATLTDLATMPEIDDPINGNVKVHWEYRP